MGDFLESVQVFQQGMRDASSGAQTLGKGIRDEEERKRKEKVSLELGDAFGATTAGQTELGQVASLGIKNQAIDAGSVVDKFLGMKREEFLAMGLTDPNSLKDPAKMKMWTQMADSYANFQYNLAQLQEKAKAVWRGYGTGGSGSGDGSGGEYGKGEFPKPLDLQSYDQMVRNRTEIDSEGNPTGIVRFKTPSGKDVAISVDDPLEIAITKLSREKEGAGWFSSGEPKYNNDELNYMRNYVKGFKKDVAGEVLEKINPKVYAGAGNAPFKDRDSEKIVFNDLAMGTKNATSEITKEDGVPRYKTIGFERIPVITPQQTASGHMANLDFLKRQGVTPKQYEVALQDVNKASLMVAAIQERESGTAPSVEQSVKKVEKPLVQESSKEVKNISQKYYGLKGTQAQDREYLANEIEKVGKEISGYKPSFGGAGTKEKLERKLADLKDKLLKTYK